MNKKYELCKFCNSYYSEYPYCHKCISGKLFDPIHVLYECDKKACGVECPNELCHLTKDISHAENFKFNFGFYEEQKGK